MTDPTARWTSDEAHAWRQRVGSLVGANFLPSTAGNQLEMWQAQTFDPETIDRELGFAAAIGMNVMRVYLHDLVFHDDRDGLFERIERYRSIADAHGIGTMFVFLDDCWFDEGALGTQPDPIPGVHNSMWLRCPLNRGVERAFGDEAYRDGLRRFVCETIDRFRDDARVVAWDLYNEPRNGGKVVRRNADGSLADWDQRPMSPRATLAMVNWLFDWAGEVNPSQPLTVCVWQRDWADDELNVTSLRRSDVPSFHCYGAGAERMVHAIDSVAAVAGDRPMMCTEFVARTQDNGLLNCLPVLHERGVAAIQWGLVAGRSNTHYPWSTWDKPGPLPEPPVWHHDLFRRDGSAYDDAECALIRRLTAG
ncbi:MAG: 1,4-beta-xylanase [Planctomycetota bacterium]